MRSKMDCKVGICICYWIISCCLLHFVAATHFNGASVSWRAGQYNSTSEEQEILIDFRLVWRAYVNSTAVCTQSNIDNGDELKLIHKNTQTWKCISGCVGTVGSSSVTCSEYDYTDDWAMGVGTLSYFVNNTGPIVIQMNGCCWITSLSFSGTGLWRLPFMADLGKRSDTEKPNNSPVASVNPVVRFQVGCPDYVDIWMHDVDGDLVTCRYAEGDECIDNTCTSYQYIKLSQPEDNKCRITYNGGGIGDTNLAIVIVIEDYSKEDILVGGILVKNHTSLSSVSSESVLKVFKSADACFLRPVWMSPTFASGRVTSGIVGLSTIIEIAVRSSTPIERFIIAGPIGIEKSEITNDGEIRKMTLTWVPQSFQQGSNAICVSARDENQKYSEQRCTTVVVGVGSSHCTVGNGGCSDFCVSSGSSYYCECQRDCWQLAEDSRTCIPIMVSDCQENAFSFELERCAIAGSSVTIGYKELDETLCVAEANSTHFRKTFAYNECGSQSTEDFKDIHYHNNVRVWLDDVSTGSGESDSPITRGYWYNINLICSFNKYGKVNKSYTPQDVEEGRVSIPGLGSFDFYFDFYKNQDFEAPYSPYEYPVTVTVNSNIYFGVKASGGSDVEVFMEGCVAMTTKFPTSDTISYSMIEKGCNLDDTLRTYDAKNRMELLYSIKAFKFQQLVDEELITLDSENNIYIQCSAVLCVIGEPSTRCKQGCIEAERRRKDLNYLLDYDGGERRQKRDAENDEVNVDRNISESTVLEITVSGPFRIEVVQEPVATDGTGIIITTEESSQFDTMLVVTIGASIGGFLILILLLVIMCVMIYHFTVLQPKRKILPNEPIVPQQHMEAWTSHNPTFLHGDRPPDYDIFGPKPPQPPFWDMKRLT